MPKLIQYILITEAKSTVVTSATLFQVYCTGHMRLHLPVLAVLVVVSIVDWDPFV